MNDLQVATCPGLVAYDSAGQLLTITQGAGHVYLAAPNGLRQLTLQTPSDDIAATDVTDPKGQVQLVVKLTGAGNAGNDPLKDSGFVFNLRGIAPRI